MDNTGSGAAPFGRRLASPCRLTLAAELGGGLDGGWWPHTSSIGDELPDLVDALRRPLGQVVDIGINWSPSEGIAFLHLLNRRGVTATPGPQSGQLRVMAVTGTRARADLLVVPWQTSSELAVMVLRQAAGLPVLPADHDTPAFQVAGAIIDAARAQCAAASDPPLD